MPLTPTEDRGWGRQISVNPRQAGLHSEIQNSPSYWERRDPPQWIEMSRGVSSFLLPGPRSLCLALHCWAISPALKHLWTGMGLVSRNWGGQSHHSHRLTVEPLVFCQYEFSPSPWGNTGFCLNTRLWEKRNFLGDLTSIMTQNHFKY